MAEPRSVLVTGASRGIGAEIARRFAEAGDKVASFDMSADPPEGVDGVLAVQGDVSRTEDVDAAFKAVEAAHGPVEVLVANAGIVRDRLLLRMSDADFDAVLGVNLAGAFRCARRASGQMARRRSGRIILMGSVVGLGGGQGQTNYSASKAGLVGLARSIARELGSRGVTANVVAPGFIETDMTAALPEARREAYRGAIPAGRFGSIADIAAAVEFLASPGAGYINGAVIPVDGGLGMGH
ncbi:MAG: 3-oxoacyl-ACP reductase FabG [Bifidobacteriaceae bacterium]|jgi:3-oxoacyl-[acyl-carrier protein] reductase|nr:3-oxoacyl-ACP reductase FabG [Bifidobacteriaceae bacterium]